MDFETYDCDRCGGNLTAIDSESYKCQYCGKIFHKKDAEEKSKSFKDMFDEMKREHINNLRRNLYDAVNAEYISSFDVKMRCEELKKYLPDDFSACFYEVAVGNNVRQLTKYIRKIDVEKNYEEIECVVKFLIKSLQTEYQLELNNLIARAYEKRDPEKFEQFCTMLSLEAVKVDGGVYETKLPREVFIAYSSKDMDKVSELCEFLESQGLKCFVAARNLRHGKGAVENYNKALEEAMDHSKCIVFVSSMNSRNFNCDALTIELPYIQQKDINAAPAEYRNNYKGMPQEYKKPRVEYRIGESLSRNVADSISDEIFDGYERVYSPDEVAARVMKQLVAATEIKRAAKRTESSQTIVQVAANDGVSRIAPVLRRARISIEDGEWNEALNSCDRALDIDPECADIYVLKLMVDMRVKTQDDLAQLDEPFDDNTNFKKAVRFGNEETANVLNGYIRTIKERNEAELKNTIYSKACELMAKNDVVSYNAAIVEFNKIPDWRDSREQTDKCREMIVSIKEKADIKRKNEVYDLACELMGKDEVIHVEDARARFDKIRGWKDAEEKIRECDELLEKLRLRDAERELMARKARMAAEAKAKKIKKIALIAVAAVVVLIVCIVSINELAIKQATYADAIELYENGKFSEAIILFEKLGEKYKKAEEYIAYCEFACGKPQRLNNYIKSQGIELFNIPQGTTTIGDYAFRSCTNLKEVVIPESVTTIGAEAFNGCEKLEKIVIPDSVTNIGDYAFNNCKSLTSVEIGDSVTSIGNSAFSFCTSLTSVVIGDSVTSIGDYAFRNCDSLTSVEIGDSVTIIGISAFSGCTSLTSVAIPVSVTSIGNSAFYNCTSLTSVEIGDSVTSIGDYAFRSCDSLTSVVIPDSVTSIGSSAFRDCTSLTSVVIGDSVTRIGNYAFYNCTSLTSVEIGDSVTSIGDYAFRSCDSLTSVVIPDSVTSIGERAFYDCDSLTSVTFKNPNGWWYSSSSTATSGTSISSSSLADAGTAAKRLKSTYSSYYWKRS